MDNKSAHLERLRELIMSNIPGGIIRQLDPRDITDDIAIWASLIIISGGQGRSIVKNPGTFHRLIEIIERHNKPTIGICLGAEAIATYFSGTLSQLPVRRVGNVRLLPEMPSSISLPQDPLLVYEFHRWVIGLDNIGELSIDARSKDGVELFHHREHPIWGMQFHPEVYLRGNHGHLIFKIILAKLNVTGDVDALERKLKHDAHIRAGRHKPTLSRKNSQ